MRQKLLINTNSALGGMSPDSFWRVERQSIVPAGLVLTSNMGLVLASASDPKSSLMNLLRPLVASGYLEQEGGGYCLGTGLFELSAAVLSRWDLVRVMRPFLEELSVRTQESVYLAVLDRVSATIDYAAGIEGSQSIHHVVPAAGSRVLHQTAEGRVLRAFMEQELVEEYLYKTPIDRGRWTTIPPVDALRLELERVRRR